MRIGGNDVRQSLFDQLFPLLFAALSPRSRYRRRIELYDTATVNKFLDPTKLLEKASVPLGMRQNQKYPARCS